MAEEPRESFLDKKGTATLWAAIKTLLALKADKEELDDKTSQDDVAVAIAAALTKYLTKESAEETYTTKEYVALAIATALGDAEIKFSIVEKLPESGENGIIYLVPKDSAGKDNDVYDEYIWVDSKFEHIGSTAVDLTGYWNRDNLTAISDEELEEMLK